VLNLKYLGEGEKTLIGCVVGTKKRKEGRKCGEDGKNCRLDVIILVLDFEEKRRGDALKVLEGTLSNKKNLISS
jgi:hypothetical protein